MGFNQVLTGFVHGARCSRTLSALLLEAVLSSENFSLAFLFFSFCQCLHELTANCGRELGPRQEITIKILHYVKYVNNKNRHFQYNVQIRETEVAVIKDQNLKKKTKLC